MHASVIVWTSSGHKLSAVASTEHSSSSHGLPVILVDREPIGPADVLVFDDEVEAIVAIDSDDAVLCVALERAGYPVRLVSELDASVA